MSTVVSYIVHLHCSGVHVQSCLFLSESVLRVCSGTLHKSYVGRVRVASSCKTLMPLSEIRATHSQSAPASRLESVASTLVSNHLRWPTERLCAHLPNVPLPLSTHAGDLPFN